MVRQKKRWELRVFDWIYKNRRAHMQELLNNGKTIHVGLKTIYKTPVNGVIKIYPDKAAIMRVGFYGIGISILFVIIILKNPHISMGNLIWLVLCFSPFWGYGIYYYAKSKSQIKTWRIDLNQKKIILTKIAVPFDRVKHLNFKKLVAIADAWDISRRRYSYSLNLVMHDDNEITLFTDENETAITDTGKFIGAVTGIWLECKITNA